MTLEEICAFPLTSILAPDAVVWLWATNYHVSRGIHNTVLDAHVLQPKQMLTWGKPHIGGGTGCVGKPSSASWRRSARPLSRSQTRALCC